MGPGTSLDRQDVKGIPWTLGVAGGEETNVNMSLNLIDSFLFIYSPFFREGGKQELLPSLKYYNFPGPEIQGDNGYSKNNCWRSKVVLTYE
jgi:hypothetical protein